MTLWKPLCWPESGGVDTDTLWTAGKMERPGVGCPSPVLPLPLVTGDHCTSLPRPHSPYLSMEPVTLLYLLAGDLDELRQCRQRGVIPTPLVGMVVGE